MNNTRVPILDRQRIDKKLQRMAYELWEQNSSEQELLLVGIESGGLSIAKELARRLEQVSPLTITVTGLQINKRSPLDSDTASLDVTGKAVVLVDDVANSGRTLMYALKPLLNSLPSRLLVAVLVDRQHKTYPIATDIVGHTIATTLQDNIIVEIDESGISGAYLE